MSLIVLHQRWKQRKSKKTGLNKSTRRAQTSAKAHPVWIRINSKT